MKPLELELVNVGSQFPVERFLRADSIEGEHSAQTMTDLDRVERCLKGEREAFDEIVRQYQRPIYRVCFRYAHNAEDAYDLAQDAFMKAYQGLRSFNRRASFKTWLYRVAINNCINYLRRQQTRGEDVGVDGAVDQSVHIHELAERNQQLELMRAALEKLPPRQQSALKLRVYEQMSYEEIAIVLKCTVSTAKTNVFFGLANLRKVMKVRAVEPKKKG
jgi:RNA polymerase sigma-70 factor (ECF subfamily)